MGTKRKRGKHAITATSNVRSGKRLCLDLSEQSLVNHPTLKHFYPSIRTLRSWLIFRLPSSSSKSRLRRIALAGLETTAQTESTSHGIGRDVELASLLDNTLICSEPAKPGNVVDPTEQDLLEYSQRVSSTRASTIEDCSLHQPDVSLVVSLEISIKVKISTSLKFTRMHVKSYIFPKSLYAWQSLSVV